MKIYKPQLNNREDAGNLTIRDIDPGATLPIAEVQAAAERPDVAAIARARIAEMPDFNPVMSADELERMWVDPTSGHLIMGPGGGGRVEDAAAADGAGAGAVGGLLGGGGVGSLFSRLFGGVQSWPGLAKSAVLAAVFFLLLLVVFKAPIIVEQAKYTINPAAVSVTPDFSTDGGGTGGTAVTGTALTIPKINVYAPVIYVNSLVETDILKALEGGVVHYASTALPGQVGNTVIFGHSSNDWWEPGDYKFVFILLDKLVAGDRFTIDYNGVRYTYEVTGKKVVGPKDMSVLNQTNELTATLITCTPPGTAWQRLVVSARQVDPAPGGASVSPSASPRVAMSVSPPPSPVGSRDTLPGAAPGLLTQIGRLLDYIATGFDSVFGGGQ